MEKITAQSQVVARRKSIYHRRLPNNSPPRGYLARFGGHCHSVIREMSGSTQLMTRLAIEGGFRLCEVTRLTIGDLDFNARQIRLKNRFGQFKQIKSMPEALYLDLRIQVMRVRRKLQLLNQQSKVYSTQSKTINAFEQAFLFPFTDDKTVGQLVQMPLSYLKNDIQLAIRRYTRFLPDNKSVKSEYLTQLNNSVSQNNTVSQNKTVSQSAQPDFYGVNNIRNKATPGVGEQTAFIFETQQNVA